MRLSVSEDSISIRHCVTLLTESVLTVMRAASGARGIDGLMGSILMLS